MGVWLVNEKDALPLHHPPSKKMCILWCSRKERTGSFSSMAERGFTRRAEGHGGSLRVLHLLLRQSLAVGACRTLVGKSQEADERPNQIKCQRDSKSFD